MQSLRSLNLRSVFGIVWLLACAGLCLFLMFDMDEWILLIVALLFATAAVGMALGWPWSEGLSYGLALLVFGTCAVLTYDLLDWYFSQQFQFDTRLLIVLAIDLVVVAMVLWVADAVRRRFSRLQA